MRPSQVKSLVQQPDPMGDVEQLRSELIAANMFVLQLGAAVGELSEMARVPEGLSMVERMEFITKWARDLRDRADGVQPPCPQSSSPS